MQNQNLPQMINMIYAEKQIKKANADSLKTLFNHQPNPKWIKEHPFAKGVKYLPIDKIEYLLDQLFMSWRVEVINISQLFNSISVHVRLHYQLPDEQWTFQDGVGAIGIQTDAGSSAADLTKIKHDAVMKALPGAKAYAIKDAADHIGNLFGRNLNRKDAIQNFDPIVGRQTKTKEQIELERLVELLKRAKTIDDVDRIQESAGEHFDVKLFENRKNEIRNESK